MVTRDRFNPRTRNGQDLTFRYVLGCEHVKDSRDLPPRAVGSLMFCWSCVGSRAIVHRDVIKVSKKSRT